MQHLVQWQLTYLTSRILPKSSEFCSKWYQYADGILYILLFLNWLNLTPVGRIIRLVYLTYSHKIFSWLELKCHLIIYWLIVVHQEPIENTDISSADILVFVHKICSNLTSRFAASVGSTQLMGGLFTAITISVWTINTFSFVLRFWLVRFVVIRWPFTFLWFNLGYFWFCWWFWFLSEKLSCSEGM